MLSVAEARARIVAAFRPLGSEQVGLAQALGRVLAEDVAARLTQPPADVSAMDGYAARSVDVASVPARLRIVGQAPAGSSYDRAVGPGEAVRIFTGGPLPEGTDTIIIQEDTTAEGDHVTVREGAARGTYVRPAGLDFRAGDVLLRRGRLLTSRDIGIAAAMNAPWLRVTRRPRIAVLATGDEVVMPGDPIGRHQIVSSNGLSLAAFVTACGGDPIHLGIAPDDRDALTAFYSGLSADSLEARFHGACRGIGDATAQAFCGPDHAHEEGLVAEAAGGKGRRWIVGHLCLEPTAPGEVEMAIAVADAWQRRGIGRSLLTAGIDWARRHDVTRMRASMRSSNTAIIGLVRSLALPVTFTLGEAGIVEVVIPLDVELRPAA